MTDESGRPASTAVGALALQQSLGQDWMTRLQRPITTTTEAQEVTDWKRAVTKLRTTFRGLYYDPVVRKLDEAKREALARYKTYDAPLEDAERQCNRLLSAWDEAQRAEHQRILAERLAEERQRREAEHLATAAALETAGLQAQAEALLAQPIEPTVLPEVPLETPTLPDGLHVRRTYKAEVVDLVAFVGWVAANVAERAAYVQPNGPALNTLARGQRERLAVPGVRLVVTKSTVDRGEID